MPDAVAVQLGQRLEDPLRLALLRPGGGDRARAGQRVDEPRRDRALGLEVARRSARTRRARTTAGSRRRAAGRRGTSRTARGRSARARRCRRPTGTTPIAARTRSGATRADVVGVGDERGCVSSAEAVRPAGAAAEREDVADERRAAATRCSARSWRRGEVVERVEEDEAGHEQRDPQQPGPGRAVLDERVDGAPEDEGQRELGGGEHERRDDEQRERRAAAAADAQQQAVGGAAGRPARSPVRSVAVAHRLVPRFAVGS